MNPSPQTLQSLAAEIDNEAINAFIKAAAANPEVSSLLASIDPNNSSVATITAALQNSLGAAAAAAAAAAAESVDYKQQTVGVLDTNLAATVAAAALSIPAPSISESDLGLQEQDSTKKTLTLTGSDLVSSQASTPLSTSLSISTSSSMTVPALSHVVPAAPIPAPVAAPAPIQQPKAPKAPKPEPMRSTVSTKKFNPDDIFCLGCCRNLKVEHYTCPTTGKVFKSCNACRLKSRVNSKKIVKPVVVPVYNTISSEEFTAKLKELEASQEETNLDVRVRQTGGPLGMDVETLKIRGAAIAQQVYEATGYWFSHSRTNDETQSKTRLKIYACSQREDRRAPPAPKTQSRKRNRPSTKAYFPCKGNLTMTFYTDLDHVRIVYNHKKHDKYDNRKCPDHVRAFVKENLNLQPRQLYDAVRADNPGINITQAQVRYWSHHYKKQQGMQDAEADDTSMGEQSDGHSISGTGSPTPTTLQIPHLESTLQQQQQEHHQQLQQQQQQQQQHEHHLQEHLQQHHQLPHQHDPQHDQVQQLIREAEEHIANAHRHSAATDLSGSALAISVPMSGEMDTSPLTSSLVQRVLATATASAAENATLLHLAAGLGHDGTGVVGGAVTEGDVVVQQVTAFIQENEQHLLEQQQQLHLQQQQEQQEQQQQHS
ncbi:hypothetical protein BGZ94_001702 [Podila epigama]|nr:hypothetical protein BGZ94_001702 [Podila epigama]